MSPTRIGSVAPAAVIWLEKRFLRLWIEDMQRIEVDRQIDRRIDINLPMRIEARDNLRILDVPVDKERMAEMLLDGDLHPNRILLCVRWAATPCWDGGLQLYS